MKSHRASYLKTAAGALALFVGSLAAGAYVLAAERWFSGSRLLRLGAALVLATAGVVGLLVAAGGLIALLEDARESRGR